MARGKGMLRGIGMQVREGDHVVNRLKFMTNDMRQIKRGWTMSMSTFHFIIETRSGTPVTKREDVT